MRVNKKPIEPKLSALLIGDYLGDESLVREVFDESGWNLLEAPNRAKALKFLAQEPVQVVVAETAITGWSWKSVLDDLRRLAEPPQLIVTSRTADESLWAEVLNIGGYDVLARPFCRDEVQRVVASAHRHFHYHPRQPISAMGAA